MTNEEKALLIAYLVDAGELDPEGDMEVQFRTGTRSVRERSPERHTTRWSSMLPGCG